MARPKIEIDKRQFEELVKAQCIEAEVAAVLGVSVDTLGRWCKRTYKDGKRGMTFAEVAAGLRLGGTGSIRRQIFRRMQKSDKVLIFAAKNYLGMSDNPTPPKETADNNLFDQLTAFPEVTTVGIPEI